MEIIHISKTSNRRILKPKRSLNNTVPEVNSIKKCLFGVPDAQDVENLLQEQIQEDWERIKDRFGIDLEEIENMENQRLNFQTHKKRKLENGKIKRTSSRRRRLFEPQNGDRKITDFYQERKTSPPTEKKEN